MCILYIKPWYSANIHSWFFLSKSLNLSQHEQHQTQENMQRMNTFQWAETETDEVYEMKKSKVSETKKNQELKVLMQASYVASMLVIGLND